MSSYVTIELPESQYQFQRVYSVNLHQENFMHDYASIFVRDWAISPNLIKPGTLIRLNIRGKDFHGYIHDIKNTQENGKNFTKVGFIGASYVMRQASQKIYSDMTADQVITIIAKKYNFAYKVTAHPRVYPQINQAGLTDWELMVKLAKQSGYFLRAENTEIYFYPFNQDFDDLHSETLTFTKSDGGFKPVNPIYSFKPVISETLSNMGFEKASVSVAGVNPLDGNNFRYTQQKSFDSSRQFSNPALFDKHSTTTVVNDYLTATQESKAIDEHSRFPYTAQVKIIGVANLRPSMPIYLDNVGNEYSGYWTILSVEHQIIEEHLNQQMHTIVLTVATDSLGQIVDVAKNVTPPIEQLRKIIPNVRNTTVKPSTVVKKPGLTIQPTQVISLVNKSNQASPSGQLITPTTWASTHGSLNTPAPETRMPVEVMEKVRSNALRN